MWLITAAKLLVSPVVDLLKNRQQLKAAAVADEMKIKSAVTKAKVDKIERGDISDIKLDTDARTTAGLMDDISFYIFLSPAVLAFYPPALPHIMAGFKALESMPTWWQYGLGMMLVSVWGYRKLVSPIILSLAEAYKKKM